VNPSRMCKVPVQGRGQALTVRTPWPDCDHRQEAVCSPSPPRCSCVLCRRHHPMCTGVLHASAQHMYCNGATVWLTWSSCAAPPASPARLFSDTEAATGAPRRQVLDSRPRAARTAHASPGCRSTPRCAPSLRAPARSDGSSGQWEGRCSFVAVAAPAPERLTLSLPHSLPPSLTPSLTHSLSHALSPAPPPPLPLTMRVVTAHKLPAAI